MYQGAICLISSKTTWRARLSQVERAIVFDPQNEQVRLLQKILKKRQFQKEQAKSKADSFNQSAIELYKAGDLLGALVAWNKAYDLNSDMEDVARYIQQGITKLLSFGVEGLEANPEKEPVILEPVPEQGVRSYVRSDFPSFTR